MPCLRQNRALIDQRGAEGPDALQVSIKVPIALNDLEGCGPSQPRNPINTRHWAHALFAAKQSSHRSARRRGTGRPPGLAQSSNGHPLERWKVQKYCRELGSLLNSRPTMGFKPCQVRQNRSRLLFGEERTLCLALSITERHLLRGIL